MDPDLEADDFQNLTSSLSFDVSGKIFMNDPFSTGSVYIKLLTDRQTNAAHYITFLAKVITRAPFYNLHTQYNITQLYELQATERRWYW